MTEFFMLVQQFMSDLILSLKLIKFELMGFHIDLFGILFAMFFLGFAISVFWRGAKS